MREELFTSLGFYSPAFFKMHVGTTENLSNLNSITKESEATYFHEYIHFIQDISSTYGLMNINAVVDYLRYVNHEVLSDPGDSFAVPIIPLPSPNNHVEANLQLKKRYLGSAKANFKEITSIQVESQSIATNSGVTNVSVVIIHFNDIDGLPSRYNFGAYCISENMAFALENSIYPGVLPLPLLLPYNAVELLCRHVYPEFDCSPLNIIALCDASMMYFQPGLILYSAVARMEHEKFVVQQPEDIMDFIYKHFTFNYHGHTTTNQLLLSTAAEAIGQLTGYFTTEIFRENRHWINYLVTSAIDIRINSPYFALNIARGGEMISNNYFIQIMNKLGSPIVTNDNFEMTFATPSTNDFNLVPEYFWVINQIYKIFLGKTIKGTMRCEMISWCNDSASEYNIPEFTDDRCRYDPWKRATDPDPHHCQFGKMWKTWALSNKYPVN